MFFHSSEDRAWVCFTGSNVLKLSLMPLDARICQKRGVRMPHATNGKSLCKAKLSRCSICINQVCIYSNMHDHAFWNPRPKYKPHCMLHFVLSKHGLITNAESVLNSGHGGADLGHGWTGALPQHGPYVLQVLAWCVCVCVYACVCPLLHPLLLSMSVCAYIHTHVLTRIGCLPPHSESDG